MIHFDWRTVVSEYWFEVLAKFSVHSSRSIRLITYSVPAFCAGTASDFQGNVFRVSALCHGCAVRMALLHQRSGPVRLSLAREKAQAFALSP